MYPNRLICDVLEEIRKCYETRNFSYLLGLLEEAQTLANKMEAGLMDKKDLKSLNKEKTKLKKEIEKLEKDIEKLKE